MKNINDLGLFDDHFLMEKLTKLGDPLQKLDKFINWKIFESPIYEAFKNEDRDLSKGGRPAFNRLILFKALIIQSLYNLSDDQLEYQIVDRASFKRFLDLKKSDKVPDSKTFWLFREQLIEKDVIKGLFRTFNETLDAAGVFANEGKMVDASFVEAPRQRNTREENKHIKETGTAPGEWKVKPHKLAQKDVDARWTKKNNATFYGYKNHVKADTKTKLIEEYLVTDASVHDSQAMEQLLTEKDEGQPLYADSAYTGEDQETVYKKKKVINKIIEKGYRNKPLTEEQKANNKEKSRTRVRVEHVFGFVENSMHGSIIRTIGIVRATAKIGLMNLTYNISRCTQLKIV
ncbi:MAG TPA: IS5 family transposase, partial [Bacteroidales bacterium]|nr:IS5 family transposase [Bacteroidales bacterium]